MTVNGACNMRNARVENEYLLDESTKEKLDHEVRPLALEALDNCEKPGIGSLLRKTLFNH